MSPNSPLHLIIIAGPTAVGKTKVAIELAKLLQTEIISSDSRQFYKETTIGTAKPTTTELNQVRHHFINTLSIADTYSVGNYERECLQLIEKLSEKHQYIVMAGGSGLFIKAIMEGLDDFPPIDKKVFQQLTELYNQEGIEALRQLLLEKDPDYHKIVDLDNHHRLIRALSVCMSSDQAFSSFLTNSQSKRAFTSSLFVLNRKREDLYDRINQRVDKMIDLGLIDEAKSLYKYKSLRSMQTVGYKELFSCFDGEISLETAIDKIKQHSRNYAKRQLTWFKGMEQSIWIDLDDISHVPQYILKQIKYNENLES